jgi:3-deoxy-manno-octulosonate cytidylyltransferase (CMP-KDO synthetase)
VSSPAAPRAAAILPVRYASTRLPGKPLLAQTGRPLIRHVWEQVRRARRLDPVIVATDDERIAQAARAFGAQVELTDAGHPSGSDRVAEVVRRLPPGVQLVLNVQGDEPEVDPGDLDRLVERLAAGGEELVTLARPLGPGEAAAWRDPHTVKVVCDEAGRALYFSRSPIPHGLDGSGAHDALAGAGSPAAGGPAAGTPATGSPAAGTLVAGALAHQGVYGWRREALLAFAAAPPSALERAERLEQLRALALGMRIGVVLTDHASLGIDTPQDYARFVERHARREAGALRSPRAPGSIP